MLNTLSFFIINYYRSRHEVIKEFLLYNAMLSSSALVEHCLL